MTEEEKKSIEILKQMDDLCVCVYKDNHTCIGCRENAVKTLLNLIEKLQKENQELENTKNNCPKFNTSGITCKIKECDYIPKDKIRHLLKIDNISTDLSKTRDLVSCDIFVDDIIELLEEE